MSARLVRASTVVGLGGAALVLAGALLAVGQPARADIVDDGASGLLTIDANPRTIDIELDAGESGDWLLTPRLDADSSSPLDFRVISAGVLAEHPGGLRMSVEECATPWVPGAVGSGATCAGSVTLLFASTAFATIDPAEVFDLGELPTGSQRYLRVVLELPETAPDELQGAHASLALGFAVEGDSVIVDNEPPPTGSGAAADNIAQTGAALAIPFGLAVVLGGTGVVLRALARRHPEEQAR